MFHGICGNNCLSINENNCKKNKINTKYTNYDLIKNNYILIMIVLKYYFNVLSTIIIISINVVFIKF